MNVRVAYRLLVSVSTLKMGAGRVFGVGRGT